MIVHDLDVVRIAVLPVEANAPLVVDVNAVLAGTVALELFEPIAGRHPKILELLGGVDKPELAEQGPMELGRESADWFALEQALGIAIAEALDHGV